MSYILDALNKADQTRKQGETNVQNTPSTDISYIQQQQNNKLLLIALAAGFVLLLFWFSPWQSPAETKVTSPITNQTIDKAHEKLTPALTQLQSEPIQSKAEVETMNPQQESSHRLSDTATESKNKPMPNIMALPEEILAKLPNINISAHTYSKAEDKRMVIINNKVLRENRYITDQLILKNITQKGVELEFNGVLFSMSAFDSWPF